MLHKSVRKLIISEKKEPNLSQTNSPETNSPETNLPESGLKRGSSATDKSKVLIKTRVKA
jgi:hypothetical protein